MTIPTLETALEQYLLVDRSEQTRQTYSKFLRKLLAAIGPERPVNVVSAADIDAYVRAMKNREQKYANHPRRRTIHEPLSPATIYKNVKMIKTFFRWCEKKGFVDESPAGYLVNRRPERALGLGKAMTDEELELILAAARFNKRDRALVLLLANSGARAGEVRNLRIQDLDLVSRTATVDGKGSIARRIYFDAETAAAIQDWLAVRPDDAAHDRVFTSSRGHTPLTPRGVSAVVRRLCQTTGIRELGAHSLRHRVGLKFARAHVAPRVTQHYLGHKNLNTTLEYYQDVDEDDLRKAGMILRR